MTPNGDARAAADPSESSFIRLAEAYRREGLLADAIRICREGLTRCPTSLRGRILLGQTLLEQGAIPLAMAEFDRVEREASRNPEILALLGEARRSVSPPPTDAVESAETSEPWVGLPETDRDPASEPGVLFLDFSEPPDAGGQCGHERPGRPVGEFDPGGVVRRSRGSRASGSHPATTRGGRGRPDRLPISRGGSRGRRARGTSTSWSGCVTSCSGFDQSIPARRDGRARSSAGRMARFLFLFSP